VVWSVCGDLYNVTLLFSSIHKSKPSTDCYILMHVMSVPPLCSILDLYAPDDFFITALENKVALSGCLLHVFLAMQQIKQNAWLSPTLLSN